ncbi:extracellular solute-binding protein [Mollicutes bacterium LVI A0039]|nr:extracellular solute-binding protein [Mollicutes bacterium LVI A0039]
MKKIIALLTAFILVLAGCSGEVEGDNILKVWYWDPYINGTSISTAAEMYKTQNLDVEFEFVEMAREDMQTKFTTAALAGDMDSLPDVILLGDDIAPMYLSVYNDLFATNLNDVVDYSNFPDYKVDPMTVDGTVYGLPFDNGVSGLYCNNKIIEEAGLSKADFENLTWSQFDELGLQIREKTGKYAYSWSAITNLRNLVHSAGTDYVNEDGSLNIADNEILKSSMQEMQDMYSQGYVYDAVDWTDYVGSITNGDAACTVSGAWFVPTIKQIEGGEGNWFIAEVPRLDTVEGAANATAEGGSSWYILENGDQDVAAEFLNTTLGSSSELYDQLLTEVGLVATYLPAAESDTYKAGDEFFGGQTIYSDFLTWSDEVPPYLILENAQVAQDSLGTYINAVVKGEMTVEEAIAQSQAQAEQTAV